MKKYNMILYIYLYVKWSNDFMFDLCAIELGVEIYLYKDV